MTSIAQRYISVRRREILLAVKDAITRLDSRAAVTALRRGSFYLGGRAVALQVGEIISGRISDTLNHDAAAQAWRRLCSSLPASTPAPVWCALESLAQAIGCFRASADFGEKGFDALSRSRDPLQRFIGAINTRNREAAVVALGALSRDNPQWSAAAHYLWLWSGGVAGEPQWSVDSRWLEVVEGKSVTIVGPAPTTTPVSPENLIARVIAPGVTNWPESDTAQGRCDLAYANSKSTKWFVNHSKSGEVSRFCYLSYRTSSGDALRLERGRVAFHHKALLPMPWDRTNMVPVAAWDLLHVPDTKVSIVASNFFASRTAYTANDVRFDAERNQATDQSGSTGIVFERCVSFSFHNIGAHLNFMANLARAGDVSFDAEGSAVVAMSYRDYLAEIDELYGVDKV